MQRLGVSGAVRPIYGSLGVKTLMLPLPALYRPWIGPRADLTTVARSEVSPHVEN